MDEVFFVSSASPGAVLRFLERLTSTSAELVESVLLSDGVGPQHWRALVGQGGGSLRPLMPRLAIAFPTTVYWLDVRSGNWMSWGADGSQEGGQEIAGKRVLWQRPVPPAKTWAHSKGLPLERAISSPPIIDYITVAQLDQKGKLVENTPRFYRFPLWEVQ